MEQDKSLIHMWISFSKYHNMIFKSLEFHLQKNYNLGLNEFYLLLFLKEASGQKLQQVQIQKLIGLSQSALSRLISRMENYQPKLVNRTNADEDKRCVYIQLSDAGKNYIGELCVEITNLLQHSLLQKDIDNIRRLIE